MEQIIIIRYGELTLKQGNKINFINKLKQNIITILKDYDNLKYTIFHDYIEVTNFLPEQKIFITKTLTKIFGISNFSWAWKIPKKFDLLTSEILNLLDYNTEIIKTFKLFVSRNDKNFIYNSEIITKKIAGIILENTNLKVNVKNPDLKIYIQVKNDYFYFYDNKIQGARGLPVGSCGRVLLLLSGGIDSPVAAYKLMKRGIEVIYLHFATPPITSEKALEKVKNLVKNLKVYNNNSANLYVCNFLPLQNELMHISLASYRITLMRRMFIKIANILASKLDIIALGTGESLGQVASQTLASINVINNSSQIPILRPLIAEDKIDIIDLSKKINTYNLSILPFEDCCSLFVPKNPVTNPKLFFCEKLENELNDLINISNLINDVAQTITKIKNI